MKINYDKTIKKWRKLIPLWVFDLQIDSRKVSLENMLVHSYTYNSSNEVIILLVKFQNFFFTFYFREKLKTRQCCRKIKKISQHKQFNRIYFCLADWKILQDIGTTSLPVSIWRIFHFLKLFLYPFYFTISSINFLQPTNFSLMFGFKLKYCIFIL